MCKSRNEQLSAKGRRLRDVLPIVYRQVNEMDALARVESRILDVQSRIAQLGGRRSAAPATSSFDTSTVQSSAASTAPFRDVASAAQRSLHTGASSLSSLMSSTSASGVTSATTTKTAGSYGPITLPTAILGMKNGQLPADSLESIGQGEHRLERSAAVAFRRMETAAANDGVTLTVSDSYRSLADQQQTAANVGLYRDGGLAAVPGTSTHGWGLSIDVDTDARTQQWLRANANRFGFANDVAREPWHYTYRPADI
jgi:D-alanyl-D-alanine carboxypeptidase